VHKHSHFFVEDEVVKLCGVTTLSVGNQSPERNIRSSLMCIEKLQDKQRSLVI
jgi:hypothetical protein